LGWACPKVVLAVDAAKVLRSDSSRQSLHARLMSWE
jgi:hypothetical protein